MNAVISNALLIVSRHVATAAAARTELLLMWRSERLDGIRPLPSGALLIRLDARV